MRQSSIVRLWNICKRHNPFFRIFPSEEDLINKKILLFDELKEKIFGSDFKTILDLGSGEFLSFPRSVFSQHVEIYAVDLYPPSNYSFSIKSSATKLPFKSGSFSCVIASELIEHVENPKEVVKEIVRVLSPRGIAIITTPWLHDVFTQPERLFLAPFVNHYLIRNKTPKSRLLRSIINYWVESRKRGSLHISWRLPNYWRNLFGKYFNAIIEIGILVKPLGLSRNPIISFLFGSSLFYICNDPRKKVII